MPCTFKNNRYDLPCTTVCTGLLLYDVFGTWFSTHLFHTVRQLWLFCSMIRPSHEDFHYEFMGPYGPAVITVALPFVVLGLSYACNAEGCLQLFPQLSMPGFASNTQLYTHEAMLAVVGWFALVLALHLLLPGQTAQGVELPNKRRLTYTLNGRRSTLLVLA